MKKVTIPCQEFTLEGILALPEGDGPFPLVVVCHPHPFTGGICIIMLCMRSAKNWGRKISRG